MIGAKVDSKMVPIDYKVKTGEIIEVLTTKEVGRGPSRDWLKIVKTSEARNKIRQWFKKEKREENIEQGKAELEKEFRRNGIDLPADEMEELLLGIAKKQHCNGVDDLYAAIGYGGVQLWRMIPRVREEYAKIAKPKTEPITPVLEPGTEKVSSGVVVDGVHDCLVKFSRCCNPLPGDPIIGFITRGFGVSIHKQDCKNVPADISQCEEPERWVRVHWANQVKESFKAVLEIHAMDREGLLADITIQLSNMHLMIHSLNSRTLKDGAAIISATITVTGMDHINGIITKLKAIKGVISIKRS